MTLGNAVADDQSEKVSATDAEEASDGSADQPLQAYRAELPLKQDDGRSDQCSRPRSTQRS